MNRLRICDIYVIYKTDSVDTFHIIYHIYTNHQSYSVPNVEYREKNYFPFSHTQLHRIFSYRLYNIIYYIFLWYTLNIYNYIHILCYIILYSNHNYIQKQKGECFFNEKNFYKKSEKFLFFFIKYGLSKKVKTFLISKYI